MPHAVLGNCRLCGFRRELRLSHAIPRWAFRRLASDGPPVRFGRGVALLSSDQHAARLLCDDCEQFLGKLDDASSRVVRQEDGTFPLLDAVRAAPAADGTGTLDANTAEQLVRFGVAVLWRAHESGASGYRHVRVGAPARAMRTWLLEPANVPPPPNLTVLLSTSSVADPVLDSVVGAVVTVPTRERISGPFVRYNFTLFGVTWSVFVGAAPLDATRACLARTRRVWLGDGRQLMPALVESATTVRRVGKLAER